MNASRLSPVRLVRFLSVAGLAGLSILTPALAAQDEDAPHPAHIHAGTCAELGDVVVPLADVTAQEGEYSGAESAHPVKVGETVVDMPLQAIIDGGHAINVHQSAAAIDVYIACGDIGGVVTTDDGGRTGLIIGLGELNDSGHSGVAWLGEDGEQTEVVVTLIEPENLSEAGAESAQVATPASADAAATDLAVEIKDFAFNPPTMDVPIGGSVTWTNQDSTPHTATGIDRDALQSGTLGAGESFTQTFDTAGAYDYFCEFHAGMKGTIVVE